MLKKETDSLTPSKVGIPEEVVEGKILLVRGQKVMLDSDLAALYRGLRQEICVNDLCLIRESSLLD